MPLTMLARVLCLLPVLATPGHAQLTPEALWQGWQAEARESGQALDAETERAGDTLILRDLRGRAEQQGTLSESRLAWARLTARPDGSVHVAMAPDVAVTSRFTDADGRSGRIEMRLEQDTAEIVARGAPEAIEQVFTASRVAVTEFSFTLDDVRQDVDLAAEASDLRSIRTTGPDVAGGTSGQGTGRAGWIAVDLSAAALPPRAGRLRLAARLEEADWSFTFDAAGPEDAAERALRFDLRHGALFAMADLRTGVPRHAARGEIRAAGGTLALTQRSDGTTQIALGTRAARATMTSPRLPLETVSFTAEEAELVARLPSARPEGGAVPFGLDLALRGLLPGADLQRRLDPSGAFPASPGALAFELSGHIQPAEEPALPAARGEIESLRLRNLQVDFEGARLSGRGDLAFSGDGPGAVPGLSRPEGTIALELDGGDALLQKLGGAGLLGESQAMGLRMMLAMFTVPGTTPDSMRAEIEFTPEGRVLANGQPLN